MSDIRSFFANGLNEPDRTQSEYLYLLQCTYEFSRSYNAGNAARVGIFDLESLKTALIKICNTPIAKSEFSSYGINAAGLHYMRMAIIASCPRSQRQNALSLEDIQARFTNDEKKQYTIKQNTTRFINDLTFDCPL